MSTRKQRIEAFINSLETVEADGSQSFLLTTDMSAIGGDNTKKCTNESQNLCGGTANSGECTNTVASCATADNSGACLIKDPETKPVTPITNFGCS